MKGKSSASRAHRQPSEVKRAKTACPCGFWSELACAKTQKNGACVYPYQSHRPANHN